MKIYAANTQAFEMIEEECRLEWISMLDSERRERIKQLKQKKDCIQSLVAGLLLRYSFLEEGYTSKQWEMVKVQRGPYGKPQLVGYPAFCYSLSHSGRWVICGVHSKELGIDIQEMRSWNDRLAKRFFSKEEYERLEVADRIQAKQLFFKMWAAKESYAKLTGEGIGKGISQYLTSVEYDHITDTQEHVAAEIRIYEDIPDYMICACSREKNIFPNEIKVISDEDFI